MDSEQAIRRTLSSLNFSLQKLYWWLRYRRASDLAGDLFARVQRVAIPANPTDAGEREQRNRDFDREHNVDTGGWISPQDLSDRRDDASVARSEQYSGYQGVEEVSFCRALDRLPIDFSQYSFVDYGSGKGKSLFLAARYPFREIIGVEFVPELHEQAVRNITSYRDEKQRCMTVSSVLGDAGAFQPPEGPLLCFLFDPFGPPVMQRVIERLLRHNAPTPVLYANPKFQKMFLRAGFRPVFRESGFRPIVLLVRDEGR